MDFIEVLTYSNTNKDNPFEKILVKVPVSNITGVDVIPEKKEIEGVKSTSYIVKLTIPGIGYISYKSFPSQAEATKCVGDLAKRKCAYYKSIGDLPINPTFKKHDALDDPASTLLSKIEEMVSYIEAYCNDVIILDLLKKDKDTSVRLAKCKEMIENTELLLSTSFPSKPESYIHITKKFEEVKSLISSIEKK